MGLIVQKFGGTSVGSTSRIKEVIKIIISEINKGNKVVVVVSAMAGVTNALATLCREVAKLNDNSHMREYDAVVSSGEIVASGLVALALQNSGFLAHSMQGWQLPVNTNEDFREALVNEIVCDKLYQLLNNNVIPIITGFQGVSKNGFVTTLGKGGSDTTAALVAAAIKADRCDIYTDVDGLYSADPRLVGEAWKIDKISLEEMMTMSSAGAKVLHPRAALAALKYKFNMRILSSFTGEEGTLITQNITEDMEKRTITAITSDKNLLGIEIYHDPVKLNDITSYFSELAFRVQDLQYGRNIMNFITNLSEQNKIEKALIALKDRGTITGFDVTNNISTVTLVGYGIKNDTKLVWKIIQLLEKHGIHAKSIDASEIALSILLNDEYTEKVVKILHDLVEK